MNKEKYSRQIRLFGEETQTAIESTNVYILSDDSSLSTKTELDRLLTQIGSTTHQNLPPSISPPAALFLVDLPWLPEYSSQFSGIFYISTRTLTVCTVETLVHAPNTKQPEHGTSTKQPEYLKILAGVAVQEYIKKLSGLSVVKAWTLDITPFEQL
ncbi:hypothetical protein NEDG_00018 [Nematocida displodere]|uniref:Uncharacterized protein n=1 Tax=Nematocida displodere TaxID=1805483 RepID=A0A177EHT7_9MICR|nr:hypothetical protein NEDG_00018 [Nematocida displodere]